jgi:carbon-monoxide dehydrogenase medium subunit
MNKVKIMREFGYHRPATITELKEQLSQPGARLIAGGTDILPQMRQGKFSAPVLVDTSGIDSLRFIEDRGNEIHIGALTTHQEIVNSPLLTNVNPALVAGAKSVGCVQTRNRGTLGGNIANASPAADTIPPLLIYKSSLLIQSLSDERLVSLDEFILGPGETNLKPGEFIHSIIFSPLSGKWGSGYLKLGKRNRMSIAVVNAAAGVIVSDTGEIKDVRLAVGAAAPKVVRCRKIETDLKGKKATSALFERVTELCQAELEPITDVRSTNSYRTHSAGVLLRRVLENAIVQARGRD